MIEVEGCWVVSPPNLSDFLGDPYPSPGVRVRLHGNQGPPWLVVNHRLDKAVVAQWPIRLWKVGDLELANDGVKMLWSTRVYAFTVISEERPWMVFGDHGQAVASIVETCQQLTVDDVEGLAAERPICASLASKDLWDRYIETESGPPGGQVSAVGSGFSLAFEAFNDRARHLDQPVFEYDEIEGYDVLSDPQWLAAFHSVHDALWCWGVPELLSSAERRILGAGWLSTFSEPSDLN